MGNSEKCLRHDYPMEKRLIPGIERYISFCPKCAEEKEAESIAVESEARKKKDQAIIDAALDNAMLAPRFRVKTLQNYETPTPEQTEALRAAWWFVEHWRESAGMILIGNTGTGKNHLAAGVIHEIVKQKATALCTEPVKMVRAIKESWKNNDKTESEILKMFIKPDVLVIDEIGVQFGSDTERMYLTEIINDRYNTMKPTILCGNLTLQELSSMLGARVLDRLRDGGKLIAFTWQSFRGKK